MTVNTYRNGETFIYDDKGDLILSFLPSDNGRYDINVFDYDTIGKVNVYSRQNGQLHFASIKND